MCYFTMIISSVYFPFMIFKFFFFMNSDMHCIIRCFFFNFRMGEQSLGNSVYLFLGTGDSVFMVWRTVDSVNMVQGTGDYIPIVWGTGDSVHMILGTGDFVFMV